MQGLIGEGIQSGAALVVKAHNCKRVLSLMVIIFIPV